MPRFIIEQLAIAPRDPVLAIELLKALGATGWVQDIVTAQGTVGSRRAVENRARLLFNYQLGPSKDTALEFEVLNYLEGPNWLESGPLPKVSHFGMHVTEAELDEYAEVFARFYVPIVQHVLTTAHTNPAIKDSRRYKYVIYGTRDILGVDLKFILRKQHP